MNFTRTTILMSLILAALPLNTYASCYCSEPSEPSIPNGYYAEHYQMERAKSEVESYIDEIQDYKQCLLRCIERANSDAEDIIDEWNTAVRRYNNR